jgi:hypothetical protein
MNIITRERTRQNSYSRGCHGSNGEIRDIHVPSNRYATMRCDSEENHTRNSINEHESISETISRRIPTAPINQNKYVEIMATYKSEVEMWQQRYHTLKQKYTGIEKQFFKSNCELESLKESAQMKEAQTAREFEKRVDKIKEEFE